MLVHGTCVCIGEAGVLLLGPSGSGKSDLALRLIDGGAHLVADDQVQIEAASGALLASPPPNLPRALEVRGLGLVRVPMAPRVLLALAIDLDPNGVMERLPEPERWHAAGLTLPLVRMSAFTASAAAKVRLAAVHAAEVEAAP